MNFEQALTELIAKHREREGYRGIIGALELKLAAMREQEQDAMRDTTED